jgi:hypothetical protein
MKNLVLFNEKSKKYEIYKTKDIEKLKIIRAGGQVEMEDADNEEGEEEGEAEENTNTVAPTQQNIQTGTA